MKPDDVVCFCYGVTLRKLVNYIQREKPAVASMLSDCLSTGTGCGWCVPFLRKLHREVAAGRLDGLPSLPSLPLLGGLDFDTYEKMRLGWLEQDKPERDLDRFADDAAAKPDKGRCEMCRQQFMPKANPPSRAARPGDPIGPAQSIDPKDLDT